MPYSSLVNYFWDLNSNTEDAVANNNFVYNTTPAYGDYRQYDLLNSSYIFRKALKFNGQYASTEDPISIFGNGGIMFWYYSPAALGFTRHAVTKLPVGRISPILAKAVTTTENGIETITSGDFVISEIGVSDTKNAIQLAICATGGQPTHIMQSSSFLPGWHLIAIYAVNQTFYSPANNYALARIEIDADKSTDFVIHPKISPTVNSLTLNKIGYGYTVHQASQNEAMIADLAVFSYNEDTDVIVDNSLSLRCIRVGIGRVVQEDFWGIVPRVSFLGLGTEQPSTITTNQITSNNGSIYLARSNGEILKGDRPIWDTEFNYQDSGSVSLLSSSDKTKTVWTPSGLQVTGTTVRI